MRPFAVVEGMLIASLAVALIAKPKPREVSAAPVVNAPRIRTIVGEVKKLGEGTIHSWVRTTDGWPTSVGVTFTESALRGLPADSLETHLSLPKTLASFDRVSVTCNADKPGTLDIRLVGQESLSIAGPVSRTLLDSMPNVSAKLSASQAASALATRYLVKYEPRTREYTVALEGLKKQ